MYLINLKSILIRIGEWVLIKDFLFVFCMIMYNYLCGFYLIMKLSMLFSHSRPRFWHYLYGPMLILWAYILSLYSDGYFFDLFGSQWLVFWIILFLAFLLYFTFPGNLFVYGVNDYADTDTDKFNYKKQWYEKILNDKKSILKKIFTVQFVYWIVVFIILILIYFLYREFDYYRFVIYTLIALIPFLLLSWWYSVEPIRFKRRIFWDGISNILYIISPAILILILDWWISINFLYWLFAWWLWVIAMHCFSAIPDIDADKQAWLQTTAIYLSKNNALWYCVWLYEVSWILASQVIWFWWSLFALIYCGMVLSAFEYDIFRVYKFFPYINFVIWFALCLIIYFM